jgi:hypothetical protein
MQRKDGPADVSEQDHAGIDGPGERIERKQGVLDLEDSRPWRLQEASENPPAKQEDAGEDGGRAAEERKPADEGAPQPLPQPSLLDEDEQEKRQRGSRRAALLGQHRERETDKRTEKNRDAGCARREAVMPEREMEVEECEDGGENLPPADETRDGLDVDRGDRKEQRPREGRRGGKADVHKQRRQEHCRSGMQENIGRVERDRLPAVKPPLDRVRKEEHRPVGRAGAPGTAEIGRREDLRHVARRADPRVVANDRLVVVREAPAEAVRVGDEAGDNEHCRPSALLSLRPVRDSQESRV